MDDQVLRLNYPQPPRAFPGARLLLFAAELLLSLHFCQLARSDEGLRLKDGMFLPGKVGRVHSLVSSSGATGEDAFHYDWLTVVDEQGLIRRYVPFSRDEVPGAPGILLEERFRIQQKHVGRTLTVQQVGRIQCGEWDNSGQRNVTLVSSGNREIEILQGITLISPKLTTVEGLTHYWKTSVPTSTIPAQVLRAVLHANIKDRDHLSRLSIARFFHQSGMFSEAHRELNEIQIEFPDQQKLVEEMRRDLIGAQAQFLLDELVIRHEVGQYQTVLTLGEAFPEDFVSGGLLEQVRELVDRVRKRRDQIDEVKSRLSGLVAKLSPELRAEVAPWNGIVLEQLDLHNISHLQSFLNLAQGDDVDPEELVSLALSGWIIGNENSIADLPTTIRLWKVRFLIREYLQTQDPNRRQDLLRELSGVDVLSSELVSQLLIHLPPLVETPSASGSAFLSIESPVIDDTRILKYAVSLPPEYNPGRIYPVVVELGPRGMSTQKALEWWAGTPDHPGRASSHGWIVVAPEYDNPQKSQYEYSAESHQMILDIIRDVRKRFSVDSNRVFLAGHSRGGEAAWDIGLTHPDFFAGVIPISAAIPEQTAFYRANGKYCPLYIIGGELDLNFVSGNAKHVQNMVEDRHDLIYTEFLGQGGDHFHYEIGMLLDWMSRKRRMQYPREFSVKAIHPGNTNYWWWELTKPPKVLLANAQAPPGTKPKVMTLKGRVYHTNCLEVSAGVGKSVISLSPEMIDFDKRLEVRVGALVKFNNFLKPSLEAMLEDFRRNADRQRLVWARLEI